MSYNIPFQVSTPQLNGVGVLDKLGEKFLAFKATKVMVVYDKGVAAIGIPQLVDEVLKKSGVATIHFDGLEVDPPDYVCNKAAEIARAEEIDGIVAIGGGSAMDTAKAIKLLRSNPGIVNDYLNNYSYIPPQPGVPLIVIPTTAGTGSEVSRAAIITDTTNHSKGVLIGPACEVNFAIVDPNLTISLPPKITAATAFDVLAHAMEGMTNKKTSLSTQAVGQMAIQLFERSLIECYYNGKNDIDARADMLTAANLAGMVLVSASPSLGHAFGHSFGATFHVPHGQACAYFLPAYAELTAPAMPEEFKKVAQGLNIHLTGKETPEELGRKVALKITAMGKAVNMTPIAQICPTAEECYPIIRLAKLDPQHKNTVIEITDEIGKIVIDKTYEYWAL